MSYSTVKRQGRNTDIYSDTEYRVWLVHSELYLSHFLVLNKNKDGAEPDCFYIEPKIRSNCFSL